jgi:hypothetical protein
VKITVRFHAIDCYIARDVDVPDDFDATNTDEVLKLISDKDLDTASNLDITDGGTYVDEVIVHKRN